MQKEILLVAEAVSGSIITSMFEFSEYLFFVAVARACSMA